MNRTIYTLILLCFLLCFLGLVSPKGSNAQGNVDYQSFLAQHDMVWDRIPNRWEVAPYTGNGNVGFLFYQAAGEAQNVISIYVGRHDYYDHREPHEGNELLWIYRSRLPLGHFKLQSSGNILSTDLKLDLWNAELTGTVKTSSGSYQVHGFSHSLHDVIFFETDADNETIKVSWHPAKPIAPVKQTLSGGGGPKGGSWDKMREAPYKMPPEPTLSAEDDLQFCFQPLFNNRGETTTGWQVSGKADQKQVLLASVHHSFPETNSMETVKLNLQQAAKMLAEDSFLSTHRKWWHDYYPLSFLTINDPEKEAFYWIQMYKFASATRGNGPVMDLMGPWYHKTFWPMVWGDLNVELQYWTHLTANRLDVGSSLCNWFDKNEAQLFKNVPPKWKNSAGLDTLFPQDLVAHQGDRVPDMLCWIMHNYWLHCEFEGDRQRMRDGLFSKLRGVGNSYLNYLKENPVDSADGKIHIKNSWSPEYPGGRGQDINFTIGLMKWCFRTLLDINEEHQLDDPLADQWQNIVDNLVDFQIDEDGLRVGKDIPFDKPHRHYSHLLPFYPLAVLKPDTEKTNKLLRTSLDHWLDTTFNRKNEHSAMAVTGYTATGAASMYAMAGDPEQAYHYLDYFIQHDRVSPTTMYAEGNPVIESPLSFATCIHDMLLQSWDGKIRVFPAAPTQWKDVAFDQFRAQGAFLVSAKKTSGVTQFVIVKSLIGSPCIVQTDIPNPKIYIDGKAATTEQARIGTGGFIEIELNKGETATLSPVELSQTNLRIEPNPVGQENYNLFGLNKKTVRLPGHQHYYKQPGGKPKRNLTKPAKNSPATVIKEPLPAGRYVRVELPGQQRVLSLAEVQVFAGKKNVAINKPASQSTTAYGGSADRAVDGNTDGNYDNKSVTHTSSDGSNPWWEVDLGQSIEFDSICIYNRRGNSERLDGFTLHIFDENRKPVYSKQNCPAKSISKFQNDVGN